MAYSKRLIKGRVGYMRGTGWPLIVIERAKSDKPMTPVLCEVWGLEHEMGSVYAGEIRVSEHFDIKAWREAVEAHQYKADGRYFKGELTDADLP